MQAQIKDCGYVSESEKSIRTTIKEAAAIDERAQWGVCVMTKPTIYEALAAKLGREPSNAELKADFQRILTDGLIEMAGKGKLKHQRR